MLRLPPFVGLLPIVLSGCAAGLHSARPTSASAAEFPIAGERSHVSGADLVAIRHAVEPARIYRLRIINRNRIEVDLDARGYEGRIVERVEGHWEATAAIANTFDTFPGLTTHSSERPLCGRR